MNHSSQRHKPQLKNLKLIQEQTSIQEEEQWPASQDDDDENLNTENYQRSIFEELQSNFFRSSLNNNYLKIFVETEKGSKFQEGPPVFYMFN